MFKFSTKEITGSKQLSFTTVSTLCAMSLLMLLHAQMTSGKESLALTNQAIALCDGKKLDLSILENNVVLSAKDKTPILIGEKGSRCSIRASLSVPASHYLSTAAIVLKMKNTGSTEAFINILPKVGDLWTLQNPIQYTVAAGKERVSIADDKKTFEPKSQCKPGKVPATLLIGLNVVVQGKVELDGSENVPLLSIETKKCP